MLLWTSVHFFMLAALLYNGDIFNTFARPMVSFIRWLLHRTKYQRYFLKKSILCALIAGLSYYLYGVMGRRRGVQKVHMFRYFVGYQVWGRIIWLNILPPDHWACSFVFYFNSTESIQFWSHLGALNSLYTSSSISVLPWLLTYTWVKWSIRG